jgi:hypothetical protein
MSKKMARKKLKHDMKKRDKSSKKEKDSQMSEFDVKSKMEAQS